VLATLWSSCLGAEGQTGDPADQPEGDGGEVGRGSEAEGEAAGVGHHQGGPGGLAGGQDHEEAAVEGVLPEVVWAHRGVNGRHGQGAEGQRLDRRGHWRAAVHQRAKAPRPERSFDRPPAWSRTTKAITTGARKAPA
jgi:hypothetical protein